MSDPPRRFKEMEELTPAEHAARQLANKRGEPAPRFETDAYRERRAEVLADHGLEDHEEDR